MYASLLPVSTEIRLVQGMTTPGLLWSLVYGPVTGRSIDRSSTTATCIDRPSPQRSLHTPAWPSPCWHLHLHRPCRPKSRRNIAIASAKRPCLAAPRIAWPTKAAALAASRSIDVDDAEDRPIAPLAGPVGSDSEESDVVLGHTKLIE